MTSERAVLIRWFADQNDGLRSISSGRFAAGDPEGNADAVLALLAAARGEPHAIYAAAMLTAWRKTKDFLRDRLLTSGRSDVSINAVLRVMNEALNDPGAARTPREPKV